MIILVILILLIAFVMFYISVMNRIRVLKVKIKEAQADLEVYIIKRYDILMESLKVTKQYMEHETEMMINITKIRKGMNISEAKEVLHNLDEVSSRFFATAEAYPQLISSELFLTLQNQITDNNEHLSASKRLYNSNVSIFNQYIVLFPNSIVAKLMNESQIEFLEDKSVDSKREIDLNFK